MKRVLDAALAVTVTTSIALVINLATSTFEVSPGWTVGVWIILLVLTVAGIVVEVRQKRGDGVGSSPSRPGHQSEVPQPIVGTLPPCAASFQDRQVFCELVDAGSAVLSGPAGVGKTQLAAAYARRLWETGDLDALFWIDASSRDAILSGLGSVAKAKLGADNRDLRQAANQALAWLASTKERWLLVLNDLRDVDDLRDLQPPASRYGRIVVTTQSREAAARTISDHFIEVGHFTSDEAIRFVTARLADHPDQAEGAGMLVEALDHHPLGLAHAAAYIADNRHLTCAAYLDLYADRRRKLSQLRPDRVPDGYHGTIATTLSLLIDRANRATPRGLARPSLSLAALLDPNGIPESVFISAAANVFLRTTGGRATNAEDVRDALSCLHRFNLITYDPDSPNRTVRVHALVQRAVRDTLGRRALAKAARAAANALLQAWPTIARDSERAAVLRASTTALRENADAHLWDRRAQAVLFRAGRSLGESGQFAAARDYSQELVEFARWELHHDDPAIVQAITAHGHWLGEAGDPAGAFAIFNKLLPAAQQKYGRTHPFTLEIHRCRERWRADTGDSVGALNEMTELVEVFLRVLGPNRPETLYARNILARCRAAAGDPLGAGEEMAILVDDFNRIFGPDHPDTLSARNNLAGMHGKAGNPHGAVTEFTRLLDDLIRVLGPDDPRTLRTRNNRARCRSEAGDPTGAITDFERLIDDCVRVLGANHPETLAACDNLVASRGKAEEQ